METQLVNISKGGNDVELKQHIYITMPFSIYNDLMGYVQHYTDEVSGCGLIEVFEHKSKDDDNKISREFRITELILPEEQDNSGASTEIDEDMVHKLMTRLIDEDKDVSQLKLHWHSHAGMSVFHSGTDEDNYLTLNNKDFLVSLVVNRSYEVLGRVDLYQPLHLCLKDLPVYLTVSTDSKVSSNAKESMKKLDEYIEENKTNYGRLDEHWDSKLGKWVKNKSWYDWKKDKDKETTVEEVNNLQLTHAEERDLEAYRKEKLTEIEDNLGILPAEAVFFEECRGINCGACADEVLCNDYQQAVSLLDVEVYNIDQGNGEVGTGEVGEAHVY